ncbi:hypothetical protein GJAV_G00252920 [Gymnothorax javanicus]|nr:hypothetical protein GJAV_G00252920 [Gymnothorax javanicus]
MLIWLKRVVLVLERSLSLLCKEGGWPLLKSKLLLPRLVLLLVAADASAWPLCAGSHGRERPRDSYRSVNVFQRGQSYPPKHSVRTAAMGKGYRGTVTDFPGFNATSDAETLYNAMKGMGSDKETILDLITSRSNAQRQEISAAYKSLFGKDLIADLKYELTGKFERLIVCLMRPPAYHDAKEIRDAVKGVGTDEKSLIEILASRTNKQIHDMAAAYKDAYNRDIEGDVVGDTSGHFQKDAGGLTSGHKRRKWCSQCRSGGGRRPGAVCSRGGAMGH